VAAASCGAGTAGAKAAERPVGAGALTSRGGLLLLACSGSQAGTAHCRQAGEGAGMQGRSQHWTLAAGGVAKPPPLLSSPLPASASGVPQSSAAPGRRQGPRKACSRRQQP
jgi:hypothetical protein